MVHPIHLFGEPILQTTVLQSAKIPYVVQEILNFDLIRDFWDRTFRASVILDNLYITFMRNSICVRHYAHRKIICVPVAQPKTCHPMVGSALWTYSGTGSGTPLRHTQILHPRNLWHMWLRTRFCVQMRTNFWPIFLFSHTSESLYIDQHHPVQGEHSTQKCNINRFTFKNP